MNWSDVAQIAQTIALVFIAGALIVLSVALARLLGILSQIESSLNRLGEQTRPVLERAQAIADDVRSMSARFRVEADRMGELARRSVEGLDDTIAAAGQRLSRLNELLQMLQDEFEGALIGIVSVARGVRVGASVLRRRRKRRVVADEDE